LARQFHDYGYWKYVVLRRHPDSLHVRWLVPPAFVTVLGGAALLSWSRPGRRAFTTIASAYAGTVGVAAVTLGRKAGYRRTPHVALAIAIMHTAWGGGFVRSLLRHR
jgi:succinoglycan biosynthesis protein ExoA